jgi:hypothetical protein
MKNSDVSQLRHRKVTERGDDSPSKLGMKPRLGSYQDRKYGNAKLGEQLNVLSRFLRSNRGKPWDTVYSEILKKNILSATEDPRAYILGQVTVNPHYVNGVPHQRHWSQPIYRSNYGCFYVDKRGNLAESTLKRPDWRRKNKNSNLVKLDDMTYLIRRKKDGVWFLLGYSKPVERSYGYSTSSGRSYYLLYPNMISGKDMEFPHVTGAYPSSLKTLSKKEKKKYKLS